MASNDTWAGKELRVAAKNIGEGIRSVLDKAAKDTMEDFYKDYSPKYYERTGNLKQAYRSRVTIDTFGRNALKNGDEIISAPITEGVLAVTASVTFSPGYMKKYEQRSIWFEGEGDEFGHFETITTDPNIVFQLDFIQGYHGGETWGITRDWHNRQPAKRMQPSPYELMEARYKSIVRDGGTVDRYMKREYGKIRNKIDTAIMKDIAAEYKKISTEVYK